MKTDQNNVIIIIIRSTMDDAFFFLFLFLTFYFDTSDFVTSLTSPVFCVWGKCMLPPTKFDYFVSDCRSGTCTFVATAETSAASVVKA